MTTYILPSPHTPTPAEKYLSVGTTTQTKNLDPSEQCCYPNKRCKNPRVLKTNGELHRFCDEHQRRLEERRREEQQLAQGSQYAPQTHMQISLDAYMTQLDQQYSISDEQERRFDLAPPPQPSDLLVGLNLDKDDLRVLAAVLSADEEDCMGF